MMVVPILFLVHLIGDFFLQPATWVSDKEKNKLNSPFIYLQVEIHGALTFGILILFQFKLIEAFWISLSILITHFLIDSSKLIFQGTNKKSRKIWFFVDQFMHLMVITALWICIEGSLLDLQQLFSYNIFIAFICILFLTNPASILIDIILSSWEGNIKTDKKEELNNAGKYIGILERIFIFGFIVVNYWEGIGFLLAAKSVFRFGDLNRSKDRNLTEYILIGTLISFGLAMLVGIIYTSFH